MRFVIAIQGVMWLACATEGLAYWFPYIYALRITSCIVEMATLRSCREPEIRR
jgi:hypothetical protein